MANVPEDGIAASTSELEVLKKENLELRMNVSTLEAALEDAELRASGLDPDEVNPEDEHLYEDKDIDVGDHVATRRRRMTWDYFMEHHDKLARSLKRSFQTETQLLAACRRLKDSLVEKCVQLRAALHQKEIDNETIGNLRAQAEQKASEANISKEKEKATQKLLVVLRKEIADLKVRLKKHDQNMANRPPEHASPHKGDKAARTKKRASRDDDDARSLNTEASPLSVPPAGPLSPNVLATSQTSSPMSHSQSMPAFAMTGGEGYMEEQSRQSVRLSSPLRKTAPAPQLVKLTPFMKWKQQQFVITPNTPTANPRFFSSYGFDPPNTNNRGITVGQPGNNSKTISPMKRAMRRQQRDSVPL